jgi:hypothetical protein
MKNLIFSLLLLSSINLISQVNFPTANQDLKELIAIQSLLAENRMEDLKTFLTDNNYLVISDDNQICLKKIDIDGLIKENDIHVLIYIRSGGKKPYADNYIQTFFYRESGAKIDMTFSIDECESIENIIQNTYTTGTPYTMLPSANSNIEYGEGVNVEKIDRYNFIISPKNNPNKKTYLKASNFFKLSALNQRYGNNIAFFGPGKSLLTEIIFQKPMESESRGEGKYLYFIELASQISDGVEAKDKFNVDFFMSLKNFNDRIWLDK